MKRVSVGILGAGLSGSLLTCLLAQRFPSKLALLDYREQLLHDTKLHNDRSIGLLLSPRGIDSIKHANISQNEIDSCGVYVKGRLVHTPSGKTQFFDWGSPNAKLFAVDRQLLNDCILRRAVSFENVELFQNSFCSDIKFPENEQKEDVIIELTNQEKISCQFVIGADGVNSIVREKIFSSEKNGKFERNEIPHVYKTIIFNEKISKELERDVVHTWPRGSSFIHCLPHINGGFICTLVMKPLKAGEEEFFFIENYKEVLEHCPDFFEQYFSRKFGSLTIVNSDRYNFKNKAVMIGDAAHATVPFAGQGMNAALEDATVLANCFDRNLTLENQSDKVLDEFSRKRKVDMDAMLQISLNNYQVISKLQNSTVYKARVSYQKRMSQYFPSKYPITLYHMMNFEYLPYREVFEKQQYQNKWWKIGRL